MKNFRKTALIISALFVAALVFGTYILVKDLFVPSGEPRLKLENDTATKIVVADVFRFAQPAYEKFP